VSVFDGASGQRRALGAALRALRRATGRSGLQFAHEVGLAQSKVSRVELGQTVPSAADLDRWLDAVGADETRRTQLRELREAAATEAVSWRRHRDLDTIQAEVKAMEEAATRIREFHPVLIPGLLQAPGYARAVAEARHGPGHPNVATWVQRVVDRQTLLHQDGRRFEFVISEAGLRWRPGPLDVALGQLDRIAVLAGLPNVQVAILPLDQALPIWHSHHFTIFELAEGQALVHLELLATGENLRDPDDVARYDQAFEVLLETAIMGQEAAALLERVASETRGQE
jgi:transcriptional regulator with XRE-family HTH domain